MSDASSIGREPLSVSVVVPVYGGAKTIEGLIAELEPLTSVSMTPVGRLFRVSEVLLVWDRGPGGSDAVIRKLAQEFSWVRPVWLSRNYGQHAATLAGMTSSSGEWIVTLDEDGQMDPAFIGPMLDVAYAEHAQLVYAKPTNPPPHGVIRNMGSKLAKWFFIRFLADQDFKEFNSFRLVKGEAGRSVAAYTGAGVYLDVALSWVVADVASAPVTMRAEGRPPGSYNYTRLFSHFGRLVVSSGTKPLMFVTFIGLAFVILGALAALWVIYNSIIGTMPVSGWASMFVALMVVGGAVMMSLGIIAQYIGAATNMSLGKPLYVVVQDPASMFPDTAIDPSISSADDPAP